MPALARKARRPIGRVPTRWWEAAVKTLFWPPAGFDRKSWIVFALGVLVIAFFQVPGKLVEQHDRREVLAHGQEAVARIERSTGLQAVAVSWIDANGNVRQGEARTRKQVSGRTFPGNVAIKYVDDQKIAPIILTEVDEHEWDNTFWIYLNPIFVLSFLGILFAYRRYTARNR
jgi:hypothetical protein